MNDFMRRLGASILGAALLLGLAARPAPAQTTVRTHAQVKVLLAALRGKANRVNARIQKGNQELTQLQQMPQTFMVQIMTDRLKAFIAAEQAALQTVQGSIDLVGRLDAALNAETRLNVDIRVNQRMLARLQAFPVRTRRLQNRIDRLQIDIQNDRATLQTLQQQIATLQQQVSQLFG